MDLLKQVQKRARTNYQRIGASLLWKKAEKLGSVKPREEKAPGRRYCDL